MIGGDDMTDVKATAEREPPPPQTEVQFIVTVLTPDASLATKATIARALIDVDLSVSIQRPPQCGVDWEPQEASVPIVKAIEMWDER
jgi:hypothetical protein